MSYRLADEVRRHARLRPTAPALSSGRWSATYRELDDRTNRLAAVLRSYAVAEGDRIAILDKSSPQVIETVLAGAKCGAVTVPANWRLTAAELIEVLHDAEIRVLLAHSSFAEHVEQLRQAVPSLRGIIVIDDPVNGYESLLADADPTDLGFSGAADQVVLQLYTSGTTAKPKGVLTTNTNLAACTRAGGPWGFDQSSVSLCAMPLFHIGGLGWALVGLANGAHNVIAAEFTPATLLDLIEHERITNMFLVPSVIAMLVEQPGVDQRDFSALRSIAYGSSPITPALLRRALDTFHRPLFQVYGLTETHGAVTQLTAGDHSTEPDKAHLLQSVGQPYPWVELKINRPDGTRQAEPGEVGEICVRSPQTTPGYFRRPEATTQAIDSEGWFHTGDVGRIDDDGYLYITDRIKDMIISGGENVYPAEVEAVLAECPGVSRVAVVGLPHPIWGEAVTAFIVPAPDSPELTADCVITFARRRLAGYKSPKTVHLVQDLPLGATGKILKRELRERYTARSEAGQR